MTSTFQCEYCQYFSFKRCNKFKLTYTNHGAICIVRIIWKHWHNVKKKVNVETQIFDRFVG